MTPPPFTYDGALHGARSALVLTPGVVVFGVSFGVLAGVQGLGVAEAMLMSAIVCAGTAQFAALQVWSDPVSWPAVGFASLAMNARYILFGATLRPWFAGLSPARAYGSLFFLYDGNWALATRDRARGHEDAAHLVGGGLLMCTLWTLATGFGLGLGQAIGDPRRYGLDFMLVAFFASTLAAVWRGRGDVLPLLAAMIAAVLIERWFPGPWYIPAGAVAGSVVGALAHQPPRSAI